MFLDNCSAHPSEDELVSADGKITAKFLPPNVTALVQPMDQGVLESIKRVYRKQILRDLISQSTFTIEDFFKKVDMIKIVDTISSAWNMVKPSSIRNSWKKLMPLQPSSSMQNIDPLEITPNNEFIQQFARLNITFTEDDIQNWMSCDGPGYEHMDEQGIVALVTGDNEKEADEGVEDEIDVSQPSKCPFSHAEAMQQMDNYLAYYRCQTEATPENVSKLIQFREFSAKKRESSVKQTSILSFFKKKS